jgi:dTDP-4-dehydrorhamnose 3,5-epimerase
MMRFEAMPLAGAWIVDIERVVDERGFFARSWCSEAFARHGLQASLTQCSVSFNRRRGTLRGMHYQAEPHPETKLVRCTRGAVWDVVIDLRPASPTYRRWHAVELNEENHRAVYVPAGFAHGFQTLSDGSEVFYQMSQPFVPESARGVRWNDPAFAIAWPESERVISARDSGYPDHAG